MHRRNALAIWAHLLARHRSVWLSPAGVTEALGTPASFMRRFAR